MFNGFNRQLFLKFWQKPIQIEQVPKIGSVELNKRILKIHII